jgi:hypothetical protein
MDNKKIWLIQSERHNNQNITIKHNGHNYIKFRTIGEQASDSEINEFNFGTKFVELSNDTFRIHQ